MNIDPNLMAVLLGVVANGLTSLIAGSFRRMTGPAQDAEQVEVQQSLEKQIRNAFEEVAESIELVEPPRMEEVCLFITSPEVEAVVGQLYAARLFDENQKTLDDIQDEFRRLFAYNFGLRLVDSKKKADGLFRNLTHAIDSALNVAIKHGVLPAHEAKSMTRFRIIHEELTTLKKNLEFLTSRRLDVKSIHKFEKQYRNQIADRHGRITPPNFDDARKLPIDSIYVVPKFSRYGFSPDITISDKLYRVLLNTKGKSSFESYRTSLEDFQLKKGSKRDATVSQAALLLQASGDWLGKDDSFLTLPSLLSRVHRTVVLGNPGGGKSTLTYKISYDFARSSMGPESQESRITAIPLVLREYGNEKRMHNYSILQFIEATAKDRYQVELPAGSLEYLLLNGHVAIIFDGLDELLETGYRQEIRDDIESFCNLYASVPVVVTSREVGYEQAPLDPTKFETFRLAPFDEDQVAEYVRKWFDTRSEYTSVQKEQKGRDFLRESQIVSDLRSNPLMLGLMCNIYRGENYIPKNRPDVYRKCAEMLFERWDRSREIPVIFHFEDDIRPAMAYLAHWIYSNAKLQEGVTEQALIVKAADYLLEYRYENRDRAERAAREFIEFCRGRAWVFTETGTDKNGDGLYQFTHRTFLEYFTAVYLVRTHETTEELVRTLLPRLRKREWDIVGQLAFQIKNRSSEGAKDKLLSALLAPNVRLSAKEEWALLSFTSRCLEFMEPSPKITRDITNAFIEKALALGVSHEKTSAKKRRALMGTFVRLSEEVFHALGSAGEQNRETIAENLKARLGESIARGSDQEALNALEIGLHLDRTVQIKDMKDEGQLSTRDFWAAVSDSIGHAARARIIELSSKSFILGRDAYNNGLISIEQLMSQFGVGSLFRQSRLRIFPATRQEPIATSLLRTCFSLVYANTGSDDEQSLSDLESFGKALLNCPLPIIGTQQIDFSDSAEAILDDKNYPELEMRAKQIISSDLLFSVFAVLAVWVETFGSMMSIVRVVETANAVIGEEAGHFEAYLTQEMFDFTSHGALRIGNIFEQLSHSKLPVVQTLKPILLWRLNRDDQATDPSLSSLGLKKVQEELVRAWGRGEISFVKTAEVPHTESSLKRARRLTSSSPAVL